MTPPADDRHDDLYDETPPRSIFAATWFRALLVLIVIGVIGAVAVPYILDAMNPPAKPSVASRPPSTPTAPPAAVTPSPSAPASPPPSAMSTPSERAPDKTVLPDRAPADRPATAMPATPRKPFADKTPTAEKPATSEKMTGAQSTASDKAAEKPAENKDARVAAATSDGKPKAEPKSATATKRAATTSASTASAPKGAAGAWWVQVGAFRDESTAKKVAAKLREQNYKVEESVRGASAARSAGGDRPAPAASAPNPAGADLYDVFVSGLSAAELNTRLAAKGLAAEPSGSSAVIKPSLPLREAVALSKELAVDGFKVQVRRAAGAAAAPQPAPRAVARRAEPPASGGEALYRVRVGAFPDRATAMSTLKELEAKGYKPFIARGGP
jgi:cell division protein FtsN